MKTFSLINLIVLVLSTHAQSAKDFGNMITGGMICVIVKHEVGDFEKWKPVYEADQSRRAEAGIKDLYLFHAVDNPRMISAVFGISDLEQAKQFFNDPETAELMAAASVLGKPEIIYFQIDGSGITKDTSFLLVEHSVADYSTWKKAFYDHEKVRSEYKISLAAVGYDMDNPLNAIVLLNARLSENFTAFLEKSNLQDAMKDAGVTSEPAMNMLLEIR